MLFKSDIKMSEINRSVLICDCVLIKVLNNITYIIIYIFVDMESRITSH